MHHLQACFPLILPGFVGGGWLVGWVLFVLFCQVDSINEFPCDLALKPESFKLLMSISPWHACEKGWCNPITKERGQSCQKFLTNCCFQNEGTQGLYFPKPLASLQHFVHSAYSSHWFPFQVCMLSTATSITCIKNTACSEWQTKSGLNGLCSCPERQESICFSSTASLCLTYGIFPAAPAMKPMQMASVPLRAGNPEQLPPPQPGFFPDQPTLCAEGGRGHTKIQRVLM